MQAIPTRGRAIDRGKDHRQGLDSDEEDAKPCRQPQPEVKPWESGPLCDRDEDAGERER